MKLTRIILSLITLAFLVAAPLIASNENGALAWNVIVPQVAEGSVRTCPICGRPTLDADVKPGAQTVFSRLLFPKLKGSEGCEFEFADAETGSESKTPILSDIITAAKSKNADFVLTPTLLRYHDLVGNKMAASSPSSVAFHLHLVRVKDSKIVWSFIYDETQRPLSENVLELNKLIKRKFQWVGANKLLEEGIAKAMKSFPSCDEVAQ